MDYNEEYRDQEPQQFTPPPYRERKLRKSLYNRIIFGICGGMGEYFSIDPIFFRLLFMLGILMGGWGIIAYLIAAMVIPAPRTDEELDENEIERIKQSANVSAAASIILLAGAFILLDEWGYFAFLAGIGIPTGLILDMTIAVIFIIYFFGKKETVQKEAKHNFERDKSNALFAGVCSGLASYIGVSPTTVRAAAVVISIFTLGLPLIIYLYFTATIPAGKPDEV